MKYKNIYSAIHNFGQSFTSSMNYVDGDYVIDELGKIHGKGYDIEIDWINRTFSPKQLASPRILRSVAIYGDRLRQHLSSHGVDLDKLSSLSFMWPAGMRKYMTAGDDRSKEYKIYVNERK